MHGNGTSESPYIPKSWDEFVQAVGTSGAYVALPEGGGVLDINEIAPEGGITVTIKCESVEGNNWEITNAYNTRFIINNSTIENLHFLNSYIDSGILINASNATISGCKFSGIIAGKSTSYAFSGGTYKCCSMNFKFIDEAFQISSSKNGITFNYVNAVIDHSDSQMAENANFYNFTANNSFFEHKASLNGGKIKLSSSKSSVVHSDAGSFVITSTGSTVEVSEEQLKDAAYLRSVGFPIAGD